MQRTQLSTALLFHIPFQLSCNALNTGGKGSSPNNMHVYNFIITQLNHIDYFAAVSDQPKQATKEPIQFEMYVPLIATLHIYDIFILNLLPQLWHLPPPLPPPPVNKLQKKDTQEHVCMTSTPHFRAALSSCSSSSKDPCQLSFMLSIITIVKQI